MAKRITEVLIDDLDGSEIQPGEGSTVQFSLGGVAYEIDLTHEHAAELSAALAPYVQVARRRTVTPRAATSTGKSVDLKAARAWLRSQGHQVSDRGRIPADLLETYRASV